MAFAVVGGVWFLTSTTPGKSFISSTLSRSGPFIDLPPLGSTIAEVRSALGAETKSKPDEMKATGTALIFRQHGYEICATFVDDALERVLVIPRSEEGFTDAELAKMTDFYGQGRKWNQVVDNGYMEMFRRDDDATYFIFTGMAQFKTQKYDKLPDKTR